MVQDYYLSGIADFLYLLQFYEWRFVCEEMAHGD